MEQMILDSIIAVAAAMGAAGFVLAFMLGREVDNLRERIDQLEGE